MFDKRYSTNTVATEVDLDIQMILWSMIDAWKSQGKELDYLQVFDLSLECTFGRMFLKIEHHQEVPELKEVAYFRVYQPINTTIWIVNNGDDEGNAVMMYPSEY